MSGEWRNRMEGPIDYKALWNHFRERLIEMGIDQANRCAVEADLEKVRVSQGAFRFSREAIAEMDRLLEVARGALNPSSPADDQ